MLIVNYLIENNDKKDLNLSEIYNIWSIIIDKKVEKIEQIEQIFKFYIKIFLKKLDKKLKDSINQQFTLIF